MEAAEIKHTTYDIDLDEQAPEAGQYLVGIGKTGVLSVNMIKSVREVKARIARNYARYALTMLPMSHLKEYTVYELTEQSANVWVRGIEALPFFWHPRGKK